MRQNRSSKDQGPTCKPVDPAAVDPTEEPARRDGPGSKRGLTEDGRFRSGRLAGMTMGTAILMLSWPVMIESFLNSLVGLTDTVLAAGLGEAETDAIGGASYIMWFIGLVIMALGVGATAMISRAVGAGRMAAANTVLGQTVTLALILGSAVGLFVVLMSGHVAGLLNMSDPAREAFNSYMLIIAFGSPAAAMLFALIACARGAGDSTRPLQAMIIRNIVNILTSWSLSGVPIAMPAWLGGGELVSPLGLDLGVIGIALGTVVGDIAGAVVIFRMALSGRWGIVLKRRRMKIHRVTTLRLFKLGMPNFLETLGMWLGNFIVIIIVGWLGVGLLGAHIVGIRIEAFSFLPGFAMGTAAATLAGQYLGARRPDLAKRAVWRCTLIAAGVMGLFGAAFVAFPEQIVRVFTRQPTHLEITPTLIYIVGLIQVPFALSLAFRSAMRGAGDVRVVMMLTWITTYAIRLPLVYIFSGVDIPLPGDGVIENPSPFDWGLIGLWFALALELAIRGCIFTARFMHGGWMKAKV